LDGEQLVLDTNILVHWLRGKEAGQKLKADYDLGARRPRPILHRHPFLPVHVPPSPTEQVRPEMCGAYGRSEQRFETPEAIGDVYF
jgi:hypothetical protein